MGDISEAKFSPAQIDAMLSEGRLERLGMGSRRACYALPGGRLCVKCYRSDSEIAEGKHPPDRPFKPLAAAVVREIRNFRHNERRNTNSQEFRYWKDLKRRLPASLMDTFPSTATAMLLPSRGWCLVEELVVNADRSRPRKFHEEWMAADGDTRRRLLSAFESLEKELARHAVRFYDPQNVLVQWCDGGRFRLRITDFEPASRTLIPLDCISPLVVRMKILRRFARYRETFYIGKSMSSAQ